MDERDIWSVSDLVTYLRSSLEADRTLRRLWVKGEISNFVHHERSGHMYFTLKDQQTRMKAAMFARRNRRLGFIPKEGDSVFVRGKLSMYERDGQIQLYVQEMHMSGIGDLYLTFQRLKERLDQEGLFSAEKKSLPPYPKQVGVITSSSGAVIRDIITTLHRRYPAVKILLYPVSVQGESAPKEIAEAIKRMNDRKEVDVLIVGRGGGSLEELWAFNEEVVARSIFESTIPIISAVGHETDTTISDFVADVRAPTPTAAAELVAPHVQELREQIEYLRWRLIQGQKTMLRSKAAQLSYFSDRPIFRQSKQRFVQYEQQIDSLATRCLHLMEKQLQKRTHRLTQSNHQLQLMDPRKQLARTKDRIFHLRLFIESQIQQQLKEKQREWVQLAYKLDALSPLKVMQRGYSLVYRFHEPDMVVSSKQVQVGDLIRVRMADGQLKCQVWSTEEWKDEK